MSTAAKLLSEIEAFCTEFDVSDWAFSKAVANDGKFVTRLRKGADLTVGTLDRARAYMEGHRKAVKEAGKRKRAA